MKTLEKFWFGCGHSHCRECPVMEASEQEEHEPTGFEAGGALVVSCLAVFIFPILTAVTGAWLAGARWGGSTSVSQGLWQVGGALVGVVVGVGAAKLLIRVMARRRADSSGVE